MKGFTPAILFPSILIISLKTLLVTGAIYIENGLPHVKLSENAVLSGKVDLSRNRRPYNSFIGIPYGTIPDRFSPSRLISEPKWNGVRKADTPGPACVQGPVIVSDMKFEYSGVEDCLSINVFIPSNAKEKLPVMVWVHGGGYVGGDPILYSPEFFMDEDVILVSFTYRLNIFGFLSTGDEVIPGNNGLRDQVQALKWVQKFIKNFNGDPQKVTIFGESAGGAAVHLLVLSPLTNGLFHQAISQSGNAIAPWTCRVNPRLQAVNLAKFLNCPTTTADPSEISSLEILDCFRKQPVDKLTEATFKFGPRWPSFHFAMQFGPVKEAKSDLEPFLSEYPWKILTGKTTLKKIPHIIGLNSDEGSSLFAGPIMQFPDLVAELDKNFTGILPRSLEFDRYMNPTEEEIVATKIKNFYFPDKPVSVETRENLSSMFSDCHMVYPTRKAAIEITKRNKSPVYLYRFATKSSASFFKLLGFPMAEEELKKVGHGDELFFFFNLTIPGWDLNPEQEQISKNVVKLWSSFATHGKPSHSWGQNKQWKPISEDEVEKNSLNWFEINSDPNSVEEDVSLKERMTLWEDLRKNHYHN